MCGLIGFLDGSGDSAETLKARVIRMADTLARRGPDDAGAWVDEQAGVALGFRRLSIIDLSQAAHQPMFSANGRYAVVFNGEIYNHRELRDDLKKHGVVFRSTSDTEVLLECCARFGPEESFSRLWGMFAIALWDRIERILFLARDRIGKKPLYYAECGGVFFFGSELKALREHPGFDRRIDRNALAAYLRYGYVPAPHAIYRCAHKLSPGHFAVVRCGQPPEIHTYWDSRAVIRRAAHSRSGMCETEATVELDALLGDAVSRRMIADVPLGALLSGGIDSAAIVSLMQARSARPVRTFTIGFPETGYNEAGAAKAVASHLHTDHTELFVTPHEAQEVIPLIPQLYDEPFSDSSQIPTFLVCQLARRHVTVGLSGDGGDELFGGYTRYVHAQALWNILRRSPMSARRLAAQTIRRIPAEKIDNAYRSFARFIPSRWHQSLAGDKAHKLSELLEVGDQDSLYRRLVSLWKNPHDVIMDGREPQGLLDDRSLKEAFPNYTERMMFLDLVTYLPDDILVKVDRASMGVGLEIRAPLLDHRLVEWAWTLPMHFKKHDGRSKWLLRQVLYRYVPAQLVDRPKMGFGIPLGSWLRKPLRDWVETLLEERRLRQDGFFQPEPIRNAWSEHLSGRRTHDYRLWCILMFQSWLEYEKTPARLN